MLPRPVARRSGGAWALPFLAGCYGWQTGAQPVGDGGGRHDALSSEAGQIDATHATKDASSDARVDTTRRNGDAALDARRDATQRDAPQPSCTELLAAVDQDRGPAVACDVAGTVCAASVPDECGCPVVVPSATTASAMAFAEAALAAKNAGCTVGCGGVCPNGPTGTCVDNFVDGSVRVLCVGGP